MPPRQISISNAASDANRRRAADLGSRREARNILPPEWLTAKQSPAKLLMTTLGGIARRITDADLKVFRARANELTGKLREGVTAQEAIDLSAAADRERAREHIRVALVTRMQAGRAMFTTGAGPESRRTRHYVELEWPAFPSAVALPGTAQQAATELVKQPLKFACDCEHFRYRLRFICTLMGCVYGRPESGWPKLTNPTLSGIACKHALRVFSELGSPLVRQQIGRMIELERQRLEGKTRVRQQIIQIDRDEAARAQAPGRRPRAIRTTDERERSAVLGALRSSAQARGATRLQKADLDRVLSQLQARSDVSAQAILAALQGVLRQAGR